MSDPRGLGPDGPVDIRVNSVGDQYVVGDVWRSDLITIPGVGAASAYTSGDAFGTAFALQGVPPSGTITSVVFLDYDDEGITKDLALFSAPFTGTADNAAFAPSDDDLRNLLGVVRISSFRDFSVNQVGQAIPALWYDTGRPEVGETLYGQFVTRGTDNIAAGKVPSFFFTVVQ
jgi:hypothetical protein